MAGGITAVFLQEPIPQDVEYHLFADGRSLFGLPNFCNVLSNLPFLLVGLLGIRATWGSVAPAVLEETRSAYAIFFLAVSLVGWGSSYYHLGPNNDTLVWDRLPMSIAFMALFSIAIGEFVSPRLGRLALPAFLILGVFSVVHWQRTEAAGAGDLRLYALVQFLPLLIIPILIAFFKASHAYTQATGYWQLLCAYIAAKVFEYFDAEIYSLGGFVSGHTLKHLSAACGVFLLLSALEHRRASERITRSEPIG